MDVGFSNAGFRTVWANDIDKDACDTFKLNHESPVFCGDIDEMLSELSGLKNIGCVFGGPPCQGFLWQGKWTLMIHVVSWLCHSCGRWI
nr:DNA cytosine methyltransferase [Escherichia coli]